MHHFVSALSQFAQSILTAESNGFVHSVYRKTINLSFESSMLSLQSADTVLSPISLITSLSEEEMENLPVTSGNKVAVYDHVIEIDTGIYPHLFFHVNHDSRVYNLSFTPELSKSKRSDLFSMMQAVLEMSKSGGLSQLFSFGPQKELSPTISTAKHHLEKATYALSKRNWSDAAKCLCTLIGLGPGLTPSGDDFLCGIMAGLLLHKLESHPFTEVFRKEISLHLKSTNDISQAFLNCALSNQFSYPVIKLPQDISERSIFNEFSNIGHTSGMDTLTGIIFVFINASLF